MDVTREQDTGLARGEKRAGLLKLGGFLLLLGLGVVAVRFSPAGRFLTREGVVSGVELLRNSAWAPAIFVPVYAAAVALAVPGTILTLAGGAVFGLWWGTLYNWLGALLGSNLAYLLARFLGRDGLEQLLGSKARTWPAMDRLDQAVESHGFRGMLTLRLIPLVPFNVLNFGGGLVGMRWPSYTLATALGILPGTFIYTMFADAILQGSTEASRGAFVRMALSGLLLVLLSFLPTVLRKMNVRLPSEGAGSR